MGACSTVITSGAGRAPPSLLTLPERSPVMAPCRASTFRVGANDDARAEPVPRTDAVNLLAAVIAASSDPALRLAPSERVGLPRVPPLAGFGNIQIALIRQINTS